MTLPDPTSDPLPHTGIVVRGVSKRFGDRVALPPTSLSAVPGKVTLLTGHNGAGKTTLLRILATLVTPDEGQVRVNGLDPVADGRLVRHQIGLALVNERSLFWRLTVRENVELVARIRGVRKRDRAPEASAVLKSVGMDELGDQPVNALSAGQRQRTVLARALVGDPPVLLIDEPLRGLDDDSEALVLEALASRARAGRTVLVASPTVRDFQSLADVTTSIDPRSPGGDA